MRILPFKKIILESDLSSSQVKEILQSSISKPDWNITLGKALNNHILEGEIYESSFLLVMGKYGLTYGRTSLLPIMKGYFYFDKKKSKTIINLTIRPFKAGMIILGFFYLLMIFGVILNANRLQPQFLFIACVFFGVTYYSLMSKFNKECKFYEDFIRWKLGFRRCWSY